MAGHDHEGEVDALVSTARRTAAVVAGSTSVTKAAPRPVGRGASTAKAPAKRVAAKRVAAKSVAVKGVAAKSVAAKRVPAKSVAAKSSAPRKTTRG